MRSYTATKHNETFTLEKAGSLDIVLLDKNGTIIETFSSETMALLTITKKGYIVSR